MIIWSAGYVLCEALVLISDVAMAVTYYSCWRESWRFAYKHKDGIRTGQVPNTQQQFSGTGNYVDLSADRAVLLRGKQATFVMIDTTLRDPLRVCVVW